MNRSSVFVALSCALATGPVSAADKALPSEPAVLARSASIVLKVPDYQAARERVLTLARTYGGELRQARTEVNLLGQKHGSLTLQLDAIDLDRLVDKLRKVGKLYSEHVQTTDQTSLYGKLQDRIGLLKQNEGELLGFLRSPRRMRGSDILFVQYRLYQSRVEAANASEQRHDLARSARRSQVVVELFEPEPKRTFDWASWHAHAVYRSKGAFLYSTRKLVTGLYYALWFAPFWVPAAVVVLLVYRWARRKISRLVEQYRARLVARREQPAGGG